MYIIHTFVSRRARCTQHNHPRIPPHYSYIGIHYIRIRTHHARHIYIIIIIIFLQLLPSLSTRNSILPFELYPHPPAALCPAIHNPSPTTSADAPPRLTSPPTYYIFCPRRISAGSQITTLFPGNSPSAGQII